MIIRVFGDVKILIRTEDILRNNVIYCLTFPNGKKYIGQTQNCLKQRLYEHCNLSFNNKSTAFNNIKSRAIRKYMTFTVDILYEGNDLDNKEIEFIKKYDTVNIEKGYNMHIGGIGGLTHDNRILVEQYTLDEEYIKTFDSFSDAAKEVRPEKLNSSISNICSAAKGKRKSAYGFIWKEIK